MEYFLSSACFYEFCKMPTSIMHILNVKPTVFVLCRDFFFDACTVLIEYRNDNFQNIIDVWKNAYV